VAQSFCTRSKQAFIVQHKHMEGMAVDYLILLQLALSLPVEIISGCSSGQLSIMRNRQKKWVGMWLSPNPVL
jgi:hypothetical protein